MSNALAIQVVTRGLIDFINRSPVLQWKLNVPGTAWHRAMRGRRESDEIVYAAIERRRCGRSRGAQRALAPRYAAATRSSGTALNHRAWSACDTGPEDCRAFNAVRRARADGVGRRGPGPGAVL